MALFLEEKHMLRFTPQQQDLLLNNRRRFNAMQTAMATEHGSTFLGNASPLPRDVWGMWDREAIAIQRSVLAVFNDIAAVAQKPIPIGKLVHHFQTVSDSGEINVSLDGRSKARTDQPVIEYHGTPVPIVDTSFSYSWRQMAAAESEGYQLDSAGRDNANRRIAEQMENATLYGYDKIVVGEAKSYGLLNHPKRATRPTGLDLNGASGDEWLAAIVETLKLLHASNFKVPATIYLNWDDWFYAGANEFTEGYPKTILQRILEVPGVREIVPSDSIPASDIVAVVKDRRVVEVLNGMPISTRAKFRANPEDDFNFSVIGAAVLEIKFDAEGQCGVAHSAR
jgi:uncharacterized linocin/CFP29 family protein